MIWSFLLGDFHIEILQPRINAVKQVTQTTGIHAQLLRSQI